MIVVDTSAIVSIFAGEPDALRLSERIAVDGSPLISAGNLVELTIVLRTISAKSRLISDDWIDRFLRQAKIGVEPITQELAAIATHAHLRYGKGMGHPAQLNFGDCFSYALAKSLDVPLLYKGGDFARTDIKSAL